MSVELVYTPRLAEYRLSADHPLRPERFTLAVSLARAWGLIAEQGSPAETPDGPPRAALVEPAPATDDDLLLVHDAEYVSAVKRASSAPELWRGAFGIGPGDTPAFAGMHEASALVCGATARALDDVLAGAALRAFAPAGGLHHAHRGYASGFCVYNDCAVAIERAIRREPGLRVAYVDVDVHHGDGVQDAFYDRNDVLTVSIHESGQHLFPGTGRIAEMGEGLGEGYSVNVPLPPFAGDECYRLAFEQVVVPSVLAYRPDVMVAQLGADSHRADPLGDLDTTVAGQDQIAHRMVELAEQVCGGKLVATGGGGYDTFSAVPRAWACALAELLGRAVPAALPEAWVADAREASGGSRVVASETFAEDPPPQPEDVGAQALADTQRVIDKLLATHPLLER